MSYREYVGMQLNNARIDKKASVAFLAAMAASGNEPLDESWGDAVADDPSEAAEITYEANRERALARARAARRTSGG